MRTLLRDLGTVAGVQCACIVRGGEVLASSFPENETVAQAASLGFVRGIGDGLELVDRGFEELHIDFGSRSLIVAPVEKDFVLAMLAAPDANMPLLRVVMGSSLRQLRRTHDIAEKVEAAPKPAPEAKKPEPAPEAKPAAAAAPPPPPPKPATPPPPQQAAKPQPTGRPQPPPKAPPPPPPIKGQQQPARPATQAPPPPPPPKAAPKPEPAPAAAKAADKDAEPILPQVLALLTEYIGPVARVSFKRGVTRWRETSTPTVGTLGELAKILATDLSTDAEKKAFLDAVDRLRGN